MSILKVACIVGTRPEAIKMAPVIAELASRPGTVAVHTISTGQHRELLDQVLHLFKITPDANLDIMRGSQTLEDIARETLAKLPAVLESINPDLVLVQGDTSTAFISSLCACYRKIPVGHVEAGLRTHNKAEPFPEEINRCLITQTAYLHFAPTAGNRSALLAEGVKPRRIYVTGNTVIDALLATASLPNVNIADAAVNAALYRPTRKVLVTAHRRENFGAPLENICSALLQLVHTFPDIEIILPAHPNPLARDTLQRMLGGKPRIVVTEPLDYAAFVKLQKASHLILTDSGGVQEEAPSLGIPVLVLRNVTERPEAADAGTVRLVGTDTERIIKEASRLLEDPAQYSAMANAVNPYGDGLAAGRIVEAILHNFKLASDPPAEFHPETPRVGP